MKHTDFKIYANDGNDEYGIFMSILYLAGETHKRKMLLTTVTLMTAAQSIIEDCNGDGIPVKEMASALASFKQKIKK